MTVEIGLSLTFIYIINVYIVKPVYKGHSRKPENGSNDIYLVAPGPLKPSRTTT